MKSFRARLACAQILVFFVGSMTSGQAIATTEILSAIETVGDKRRLNPELRNRACFLLIKLVHGCGVGVPMIHYGNRFGVNWDIFAISGHEQDQTRGVDLGELEWSDEFRVPEIEPWPKLQPGEQRHITVNASGTVDRQVTTAVKTSEGLIPSAYNPYIEIKKGHIYAIRVVNGLNDFYILIRIDDLIRGTKASISYKKFEKKSIF